MKAALFFLFVLLFPFKLLADPKPSLVLVNGGIFPEENFDEFRFDLKAFHRFLGAGKDVEILDAGGPGTSYVVMVPHGDKIDWEEIKRSPLGYIILGNEPLGLTSKKASQSNLIETYKKNGTNSLPATYLFHDHGGDDGTYLWGQDTLTAKKHLDLQKKNFTKDKLYRSIHIHCQSNKGFLDPARKDKENWPKNWDEWAPHLDKYYRQNSCHLALGTDENTSAPVGDHSNVEKSEWKDYLANVPPLSLRELARKFRESRRVKTTVSLSSDLLIDDLFFFLCEGPASNPKAGEDSPSHGSHRTDRRRPEGTYPCITQTKTKYEKKVKKMEELDAITAEVEKINSKIAVKTMKTKYPKEFEEWMKAMDERDKLLAQMAINPQSSPKDLQAMEEKLELENKRLEKMRFEFSALRKLRKEDPIFEKEMRTWIESKDRAKDAPLMEKYNKENEHKNIHTSFGQLGTDFRNAVKEKTEAQIEFRKVQKKFVETEFKRLHDEPGIKKAKEYYDAMLRCEDSPLH